MRSRRCSGRGPSFAWAPGTTFDYSNLGYGILGRVITSVADEEYGDVVRARLLGPLGMTSTGFHEDEVPAEHLAHGYVREGDTLLREGRDAYGAFASMGGLYSTVADLARWVAGFLDAVPARDDPEGGHPLRRASRREMQQAHRVFGAELDAHAAHLAPTVLAGGYGFGLAAMSDAELGTTINHGGGYPGFGSYMTWHPASGIGIVGLANLRYASPRAVGDRQLAALVAADGVVRRRVRPSAATEASRPIVMSLLHGWDDAVADGAFAMNVDLDQPRAARRAAMEAAVEAIGPLEPDPDRPDESWSPAHAAWWLRGPGGWLRVEVLTTPEPRPTIQTLALHIVRTPSAALQAAAEALAASTGTDAPAWPDDLRAADGTDTGEIRRSLRAAAARFGALGLGLPVDGDGTASATWELWPAEATDAIGQPRARPAAMLRRRSSWRLRVTGRSGRRSCSWPRGRRRPSHGDRLAPEVGRRDRGADDGRHPLDEREPVEAARDLGRAQDRHPVGRDELRQDTVEDRLHLVAERVVRRPDAVGLEGDVRQQPDHEVVRPRPALDERVHGELVRPAARPEVVRVVVHHAAVGGEDVRLARELQLLADLRRRGPTAAPRPWRPR